MADYILSENVLNELYLSPRCYKYTFSLLQVIVALFIPPLAVYMKKGTIDNDFWINIVATLIGGLPGVIHALWVILK